MPSKSALIRMRPRSAPVRRFPGEPAGLADVACPLPSTHNAAFIAAAPTHSAAGEEAGAAPRRRSPDSMLCLAQAGRPFRVDLSRFQHRADPCPSGRSAR